ncbi:phospholipase A1 member A-like [Adelges cooleyi]|uniref:phospholipase A1 member A-like n=1 Tax=Adelges cooleyi TaxID=133065 RepID=UPI00217FB00E|nr:phospholipase A1 member A-like [Adelges cooleyi]
MFKVENNEQCIGNAPLVNGSERLVVILHGYSGSQNSNEMVVLRDEYLKGPADRNVITVDYSKIVSSGNGFVRSIYILPSLSEHIAKLLISLMEIRKEITYCHVVGFSIGAHIAGLVGNIFTQKGLMLNRITALDPLKLLLSNVNVEISPSSAKFVDVIHSNDVIGISKPIGTVDVYVNDGKNQPGCDTDWCSHMVSVYLFAASINSDIYKAAFCLDFKKEDISNKDCQTRQQLYNELARDNFKALLVLCGARDEFYNRSVIVGEHMPLSSRGVHHFLLKKEITV